MRARAMRARTKCTADAAASLMRSTLYMPPPWSKVFGAVSTRRFTTSRESVSASSASASAFSRFISSEMEARNGSRNDANTPLASYSFAPPSRNTRYVSPSKLSTSSARSGMLYAPPHFLVAMLTMPVLRVPRSANATCAHFESTLTGSVTAPNVLDLARLNIAKPPPEVTTTRDSPTVTGAPNNSRTPGCLASRRVAIACA
mmetsp:Transcript_4642/g.16955  ORF Transcript_4642/g.16955 Transcript_4642/m.16955 type:complete len:202 (-) Transcript_4642:659-1264(-)